jgi:hypothetical protein
MDTAPPYVDGGGPDGSVSTGDAGGATGTGPTGPTGSTGPGSYDSGPPATIGQDDSGASGTDGGTDSAPPPNNGSCSSLADCPYGSAANVEGTACVDGGCVITCNGDNYDVNGVLSDGCEVPGICPSSQNNQVCPVDDHTQSNAANAGSYPCTDSSSAQNITGTISSDDRAHQPPVDGFDTVTGSAPQYFKITGTGGVCQNDANLNLSMVAPAKQLACYTLHLLTDKNGANGQTCQTDATGHCSITNGSGSYGDGDTMLVWVTKDPSCTAAGFPDQGAFTITGHL